ncbi:hypothetical protein POV27_06485 [Aureisphaera galaxeae]|uniref:hypothetical protein n=1 Tax=Aureisphaera galaxeae TaxID=1538023 RepID=UPI00235054D9|nr:hypothetical protein [Aureisphaera galaxeae]MDC8003690.1 hypothetical protein [Aureisphaera galaxeae]
MRIVISALFLIVLGCKSNDTEVSEDLLKSQALIGKWEVVASDQYYAYHPPSCPRIGVGTVMEFSNDGRIRVYYEGETFYSCNGEQSYWIEDNKLIFFELESTWESEILELSEDRLTTKTASYQYNLSPWLIYGLMTCEPITNPVNMPEDDIVMSFRKVIL